MPKVSVVIPAYNAMSFLPKTLNSVLAQTFEDYEVIIVDDGSSDSIRDWSTQITDPRVQFIFQANQGAAIARNTGITQSQGEYIAFLDADDLWAPTKLAQQVELLDQDPEVGLVYAWIAVIDSQDNLTGKVCQHQVAGDVWEKLIEHNVLECSSTPMVRRACFDRVGLFDPTISRGSCGSEDWEMWLRIAAQYSFAVVPESLVYYRVHSRNGSRNWTIMEQDYQLILDKIFAHAPADRQHLKSRSQAAAYLRIAWKVLQNMNDGVSLADSYRQKAVAADPTIRSSGEYIRFSIALFLVKFFGLNGYSQFREFTYRLKESCVKVPQRLLAIK